MKTSFWPKLLSVMMLITLLLPLPAFGESQPIRTAAYTEGFDVEANWSCSGSCGAYGAQAYANPSYPQVQFSSAATLRETPGTQDGYAKTHNASAFAWRLQNADGAYWQAKIATGGVGTFSVWVRRWDSDPEPIYAVEYSTNNGSGWTPVQTIDNAWLGSSDWKQVSGIINTGNGAGEADDILIRIWRVSGERLMVDDFEMTDYGGGGGDAAPVVQSTTPASNATGVATDADITITFSEPVVVTSTWHLISCASSGVHSAAVSGGPTTFTLDPEPPFAAGESCAITLYAAQISDVDDDDPPDTMTANYTWSFTTAGAATGCDELFFSEYVEGSSNNKALEIYNGSAGSIDLSAYTVELYSNGASSPNATATLVGQLLPGEVYVIANPSAGQDVLDVADLLHSGVTSFNGDDAIALKHNGSLIDVIGQIGVDPGDAWSGGEISTKDQTLRRQSSISLGDADGSDLFNPAAEWDGYAIDTFDGLGEHLAFCGGDAAPRVVSVSPANGASGVAVSANIAINFSEPVTVMGSWVAITCGTSGSHPAQVSGGPQSFTLDPVVDFTAPEVCHVTISAAQVNDQDAEDPPDYMTADYTWSFGVGTVSPAPCSTIPQIQGTGNASPCPGHRSNIEGCITGVTATGFYFQDVNGDGNPASSDGIYAYYFSTWSNPTNLQPGDRVRVSGTVVEYYDTTEFAHKGADPLTVNRIGTCTVPAPVSIPPITDPLADPMALYERYEGMRVSFTFDGWVVGATKRFISRNTYNDPEIAFVDFSSSIPDYERIFERDYPGYQGIQYLSGGLNFDLPDVDFGDRIAGTHITGILGYQFDKYTLLVDAIPALTVVDNPDVPYVAPLLDPTKAELDICSLNVENLFDHINDEVGDWGDWAPGYPVSGSAEGLAAYNAKLDQVAGQMVYQMRSCMIIGVSEIEGKQTVYDALAARLGTVDGSHTWNGIYVESGDSRDISQGFLYRDDVTLVSGPTPVSGAPFTGWVSDGTLDFVRVPASAVFRFHAGEPQTLEVRLYAVHFKSKRASASCTTPDCTDKREKEASDMRDILAHHQSTGEFAIALGDYNDTFGSSPINILDASAAIFTPYYDLPERERWSYVFNGESEVLDHLYATQNLLYVTSGWQHGFNPIHVNADFPSNERASDHDPMRLRLRLPSDYSDLAASYGQAWHLQLPGSTLRLGALWTDDTSFAPGADDASDDGVAFGNFVAGQTATLTVTVQGTSVSGRWLRAWFDWNGDGEFTPAERVFDQAIAAGENALALPIPATLTGPAAYRVRLYDSASAPANGPTGSAPGGEVEDGFTPAPTVFVTLTVSVVGQGNVTYTPSQTTYLIGDTVVLTATPDSGWHFAGWENGSGANPRALVIAGHTHVTATFSTGVPVFHTLTLHAHPAQGGATTPPVGTHSYLSGAVVEINATAHPGWQFLSWLGPVAHPTLPATTVTVNADTVITATFNQAPSAHAGPDQSVSVGAQVTLDGTASNDPDGHTPLTYGWLQTGGPAVTLSNPQAAQATFTAPATPAALTFALVVTDAHGLASAPVTVNITARDTAITGLVASSDSPTRLGDTTLFTATAAGSNIVYTWDFGNGRTGGGARVAHTYATTGVYTARITATNQLSTVVATLLVTVTNQTPLANAGPDQQVQLEELVTLDGSASSDPDGHTPLTYGWLQTGGPAVTLNDPRAIGPKFTAPAAPTVLTFTLTVTDAMGMPSAPSVVVITVEEESSLEHTLYLPLVCQNYAAPANLTTWRGSSR